MPRPKPVLRLFFGLLGWGAVFAFLVTAVGLALAIGAGQKAAHLRSEGATAQATVVTLTEEHQSRRKRSHSHSYDVTYSFQAGPNTYRGTAAVSRDRFRSLSEGDRIPVRYWTKDPSQSEITFGDAEGDSWAGWALGGIGSVVTLVLGRLAWRDATEAAWMARHGQRSEAEITGHVRTTVKINGISLWRAEWRSPDGSSGTSARMFFAALPRVGKKVTLVSDPDGQRPSRLQSDICI